MWEEEEIPPWQKWDVELCVEVQRLKALQGNSAALQTQLGFWLQVEWTPEA